jgi:hypothetical protein
MKPVWMVGHEIVGLVGEGIIELEHLMLGHHKVIGRFLLIDFLLLTARGCEDVIHEQSTSQLHYMQMDN